MQYPLSHYRVGGYVLGQARDYDRNCALDVVQLLTFLEATQPKAVAALELAQGGIKRARFLHRLPGEITKRGVVHVLRKGVDHGPVSVDLYKFLPTPRNTNAADQFARNLTRCREEGVGQRYLIQHSAGSGKSNTIAWLAYQLVELTRPDDANTALFDSVIVITDRRTLDTQISKTIKGYDHVAAIFGHYPAVRQAERTFGARQGAEPGGSGLAGRPYRVVQALQRRSELQTLANRYGV